MAPRQKQVPKQLGKRKEQKLDSENDFLETADGFELSAGKWKAGDVTKALRFYQRAQSTYNAGLTKYPQSFDLAYNKALGLYQISQDKLISSLVGSTVDLLKEALEAHRFALRIDRNDADLLFNTAQVLTHLAEQLTEADCENSKIRLEATALLQEAVQMFEACLSQQEMDYKELHSFEGPVEEFNGSVHVDGDEQLAVSTSSQTSSSVEKCPDEWATVVEPVTPRNILDTVIAQLKCLTTLAAIVAPTGSGVFRNLDDMANSMTSHQLSHYLAKIPTSVLNAETSASSAAFLTISSHVSRFQKSRPAAPQNPQQEVSREAALAIANFKASLAGAEFKSKLIAVEEYDQRLTGAFDSVLHSGLLQSASEYTHQVQCEYADSLMHFSDSLAQVDASGAWSEISKTRWNALCSAQTLLTSAAEALKIGGEQSYSHEANGTRMYLQRGDIELQRWWLAGLPFATASIARSRHRLLDNAGVHFRSAITLARREEDEDSTDEAAVKLGVVSLIQASVDGKTVSPKHALSGIRPNIVEQVLEDLIQQGVVDQNLRDLLLP